MAIFSKMENGILKRGALHSSRRARRLTETMMMDEFTVQNLSR